MDRHIVAISGGGFSEIDNSFIDDYVIKIKRKSQPVRIAFVGTASHDVQGYIDKFYKAFAREQPIHLTIADLNSPTIQSVVNELDIIYVGGGNTHFMLQKWRETNFDQVLKKAYERGVILTGISAGAMCWFEQCYTMVDGSYKVVEGLGFLKGALLPHADENNKQYFYKWAEQAAIYPTFSLRNEENCHFINEKYRAMLVENVL